MVKKFQAVAYIKRTGSSPRSQTLITGLSNEPLQYSAHPTTYSSKSILILYFHLFQSHPSGHFTSGFPIKNLECISHLPHRCYVFRSSHSLLFDHLNYIWWIHMKFFTVEVSSSYCYFILCLSSSSASCSQTAIICPSLKVRSHDHMKKEVK